MTYCLEYMPKALKKWNKLDIIIRKQFYKKLQERLENHRIKKDKLSGYTNVYKIKLRNSGFRLAYEIKDKEIVILVLSVGKRENNEIYDNLGSRT
ncbi:MAG: type II toxin-antitoxin system RelE/ParE family toxin [Sulfurimonas sp.]